MTLTKLPNHGEKSCFKKCIQSDLISKIADYVIIIIKV